VNITLIFLNLPVIKNNIIMESSVSMQKTAVKTGIYISFALIVWSLIQYVFGIVPVGIIKPLLIEISKFAISIVILVVMLKNFRTETGGYITFTNAFIFSLIALVVASFISGLFTFVFFKYFDPDHVKSILEAQMIWMEDFMVRNNVPDDEIDKALDGIAKQMDDANSLKQTIKWFGIMVIINAVIALIIAAIMKKNRGVFEEPAS
jgi:hypothetical protein